MKHRKLRIAWSVAWGTVAVLLVVLWALSCFFYHRVCLTMPNLDSLQLNSQQGRIELSYGSEFFIGGAYSGKILYFRQSALAQQDRAWFDTDSDNGRWRYRVFLRTSAFDDSGITLPHWCFALMAAVVSAAPWLLWPWRFSLRTLLIATTLVAVGLGLFAWAAH